MFLMVGCRMLCTARSVCILFLSILTWISRSTWTPLLISPRICIWSKFVLWKLLKASVVFLVIITGWLIRAVFADLSLPDSPWNRVLPLSQGSPPWSEAAEFVDWSRHKPTKACRFWTGQSFRYPRQDIYSWGAQKKSLILVWHWLHSYSLLSLFFLVGGYSLVPSTWDTPRFSSLLYTRWYLVCGMHICRDDHPKAPVSWRLRDWSTLQDFQVLDPFFYFYILNNFLACNYITKESELIFNLKSNFQSLVLKC